FGEDFVRETHLYMNEVLSKEGAHLDGFFYCPHYKEAEVEAYRVSCGCRKPLPGMLEEALKTFHGDPRSSMMVGDSRGDVLAGKSLGCHNFWIVPEEAGQKDDLAFRVASFAEAVNHFLAVLGVLG
ncbi:histidinol-phosphate phosphatase family protein, partial [mine drainage metagenome]